MKLYFTCTECMESLPIGGSTPVYSLAVENDGVYKLECLNGHVTKHVIVNPKFEVLFEIACNAISDGYYREAVSSFTAGIERFYEFYLAVIAVHKKREFDQKEEESDEKKTRPDQQNKELTLFDTVWKDVKAQSERQLGAYIFTYALQHNERPTILTGAQTKFRNSVIHKGKIPTRVEAIKYGDAAVAIIIPALKLLFKDCGDETIMQHYWSEVKQPERTKDSLPIVARSIVSIFGQNPTYWPKLKECSIEKHVNKLDSDRVRGRHP